MSTESRLSATQRLAASREQMRLSMTPRAAASNHGPISPVLDAVQHWWAAHPLRVAGVVASDAANTLIGPLAQRHPIALVAGALVLGGLLIWAKPWRGILKPALLAGLLPQLLSKAMAVVPLESWLAVLASLTREPAAAATPETTETTETAPQAPPAATPAPQPPLH